MKYLYILILSLTSTSVFAQLSYVEIDWEIDQSIIMIDGDTDTLEFDIDQDGINDLRLTSWSNHQAGIETVIEALLLSSTLHQGIETDGCNFWNACSQGFGSSGINGYLYSSNCNNPSDGYYKYPFEFEGGLGIRCGFLYVRYEGSIITIEGYACNPNNNSCSCSTSGWVGLDKPKIISGEEPHKFYNLMGQEVSDPNGLVLRVYESGFTEKVYIVK
ncbi:MAG: hypothetical protein HWE22_13970 [Flavobacteriales bacterium]|nr:hypothetical protein [Flavobacteriales bacterium]